ncbi:4-sulfomuconolactone hydrolase [Paraburkholderia sediminicola]|uniref:4-sulfomuconolactone hydrolase n=1 Tax=Paraburkholderia sediminicola TaxID=458836 RepID=A0A6J5CV25_9BURK|nr:amidohydrolase family protein [Paraburkholderia sediminicola]CAB3744758.1 4-sulfomuconolactone hydrolase [Paraburkholderia sediminicola]
MSASVSLAQSHSFRVDTHAHVFERGLPLTDSRRYAPDYDATLDTYLQLLNTHDIGRAVLVQPSFLGTDNRYLLQALSRDTHRLRGVAVVAPDASEEALADLHGRGVTGIRLNLIEQALPDLGAKSWTPLLERLSKLGWHVELHRNAQDLAPMLDRLLEAGIPVVVDHFGRPDPAKGIHDSGFRSLLGYGGTGRVWVKVSGAYRCAALGSSFVHEATSQLVEHFGAGRLMWGSDWPHTQYEHVMNYGQSLSTLLEIGLDAAVVDAILCTTPALFYGFDQESGNRCASSARVAPSHNATACAPGSA